MPRLLTGLVLLLACGLAKAEDAGAPAFTPQQLEFFETKVRPVLADNCFKCHSHAAKEKNKLKGGFYLDSRAGILDGYLAEPGKPDESMMIQAVRYDDPTMAMLPAGKLPGLQRCRGRKGVGYHKVGLDLARTGGAGKRSWGVWLYWGHRGVNAWPGLGLRGRVSGSV